MATTNESERPEASATEALSEIGLSLVAVAFTVAGIFVSGASGLVMSGIGGLLALYLALQRDWATETKKGKAFLLVTTCSLCLCLILYFTG